MIGAALLLVGTLMSADARSTVVLRYACESELGRRDITLFANGTVRVREGLWDEQALYLQELDPEQLASALQQLSKIDTGGRAFAELGDPVVGTWIDTCELELELPDREPVSYTFSGFDFPALEVAQLIHVAEGLAEGAEDAPQAQARLSTRYKPRPGDILQTSEGDRYKIVRFTVGGDGVELDGLDQPLRIYVALSELHSAFTRLVKAGE